MTLLRRRLVPEHFTLAVGDIFLDFQNNTAIKQRRRVRVAWSVKNIFIYCVAKSNEINRSIRNAYRLLKYPWIGEISNFARTR